ncbi:hypothetical protein [Deinococcus sonorensis]|uniref:Transposase n=2 Tax=Deinococcus sonorensis TaxID=309891 RepID=A0AAU7U6W2_9DEIO
MGTGGRDLTPPRPHLNEFRDHAERDDQPAVALLTASQLISPAHGPADTTAQANPFTL